MKKSTPLNRKANFEDEDITTLLHRAKDLSMSFTGSSNPLEVVRKKLPHGGVTAGPNSCHAVFELIVEQTEQM